MMPIKSEEEINHQHLICPEFSSESTELPPRNTIVNAYASTLDFEATEYKRLYEILSYPQQLAYFQLYLQNIHAHENLLFMEAMSELRHEQYSEHLDAIVHRIWKTFFMCDSLFELNVTNKEKIEKYILMHKWGTFLKEETLEVFKEAETEVKIFLNEKILDFDKVVEQQKTFVPEPPLKYQKKVVIIGGGFTGFTVASILDPMPRFHITLIDTKDSFEYTPGMIKLLVRPEETSSLRVRHDSYVKNGRVLIGYAEKIVNDAKEVKVGENYIPFDYLVIATGSSYHSKLKSFDTSSLYRLSELSTDHNELKKAKSVLIIGGGLVGCELASEIAQHSYPAPYNSKKKITLVESHPKLLKNSSSKRQAKAFDFLSSIGVDIVLDEKIIDFNMSDTNKYVGSSGQSYSNYDKVFLATGTKPCSDIIKGEGDAGFESCLDYGDRIRVKPTLQLDHWKYNHIFAGGDVTNVVEEKTGYAATLAGVCISRNICRLEKRKAPLKQGTKGTLPAPSKPLDGIESHGGLGRQHINGFKKTFSFLNPTWAALKYFDEEEFLNIVQGEVSPTTAAIGKKPQVLDLPHKLKKEFLKRCNSRQTLASYTSDKHTGDTLHIPAINLSGTDLLSSAYTTDIDSIVSNKIV